MKTLKKLLFRYKFFLLLLALELLLLAFEPAIGKAAAGLSWDNLLEMLSVIPPVFVLMGLMDVWVPKETMMKYMGREAGLKGCVFAFLLGSLSAGPLYAAFPIAAVFLKKGVSLRNVFLFLGAWSTAKIPMMLFEITQLGSTFTIVRFCFNLAGTVLLALFMEKTTSAKEADDLCQRAASQIAANETARPA